MIKINKIYEKPWILEFLEKKNIKNQYIKSAKFLVSWYFWKTDFKIRQPKKNRVWSFRVNKQYRAFWIMDDGDNLLIFEINDHQNY